MYVLRMVGPAAGVRRPTDPPKGAYLESYNPEGAGGRGVATWTTDPAKAMTFTDPKAAFDCWRAVPRNHPVRLTDGHPNRPLTAYTISVETI